MRNHSTTTSAHGDSFRRVEVITGVGRRRRWSLEEKARIVAESLDPATTSSAVARRYGLHASQLFGQIDANATLSMYPRASVGIHRDRQVLYLVQGVEVFTVGLLCAT